MAGGENGSALGMHLRVLLIEADGRHMMGGTPEHSARWEVCMGTAKEAVRKILDEIPEDSTFEDIQYHIYVCGKIERGLAEIAEGRVVSQDEIEQRMSKWLGK